MRRIAQLSGDQIESTKAFQAIEIRDPVGRFGPFVTVRKTVRTFISY
jgi:hypothetical protein